MGIINQLFQLIRTPKPTTGSKVVANKIPKRAKQRMLSDGHQLNHIVAQIYNPVHDLLSKVVVGVDLWLDSTNPNVALVDLEVGVIPLRVLVLELVIRYIVYSIVSSLIILFHEIDPCWDPISKAPVRQLHLSLQK